MTQFVLTIPAINYRLKADDVAYIFTHADVEAIIVDNEYVDLLGIFHQQNPGIPIIADYDEENSACPFSEAVQAGLAINLETGSRGWDGLSVHPNSEHDLIALSYTSGTTAKPKGVEFLHRGTYLASIAHVSELGLAGPAKTCRFLWTLPMFHAMGMLSKYINTWLPKY